MNMPYLSFKQRRRPKTSELCPILSKVSTYPKRSLHVILIISLVLILGKELSDTLDQTFATNLQVHNTFGL